MVKEKKIELFIVHPLFINNISNTIGQNIIVTKFGKKYDYRLAEKEIYKIGKAVNIRDSIRISPHTFRHYFAQKLVRENVDIYMIQKLLGHASIKTTEIYLRSLNIENEINKVIKYSPLQN